MLGVYSTIFLFLLFFLAVTMIQFLAMIFNILILFNEGACKRKKKKITLVVSSRVKLIVILLLNASTFCSYLLSSHIKKKKRTQFSFWLHFTEDLFFLLRFKYLYIYGLLCFIFFNKNPSRFVIWNIK